MLNRILLPSFVATLAYGLRLSFGVVSSTLMQSSSLVSVITISFLSAEMNELTH